MLVIEGMWLTLRRIGYAALTLDVPEREMGKPAFTTLSDGVTSIDADNVRVELGHLLQDGGDVCLVLFEGGPVRCLEHDEGVALGGLREVAADEVHGSGALAAGCGPADPPGR